MDSNKIFRVVKNEYVKWITNPKMIIVLVMLIFVYDYSIRELLEAADKMGEKLQILEGFIGTSNSQLLMMIIPIVFVGIMGDFPRVDGNAMFYIHRVGRVNWLLGEMLFAVLASATYLLAILGFGTLTLLGRCYTANVWSEVTTKYYQFAPLEYDSKVANLTTGRLYNNLSPAAATGHILGLMFLLLITISMILIVGFVWKARIAGIIFATALLCVGNVLAYIENGVRFLFPTAHAVLEIHFDEIYKKPIFDIRLSYIYYIFCTLILFIAALLLVGGYDFSKIQELEE